MTRFVDTNVLLYAACADPNDERRHRIANEVLDSDDLALSIQVLQEFYVQATNEHRPGRLTHEEARSYTDTLRNFPVQSLTLETLDLALDLTQRYRVNYWDAAILAAARLSGCDTLLTEDLSDGQDYGGVRVANPFAVA